MTMKKTVLAISAAAVCGLPLAGFAQGTYLTSPDGDPQYAARVQEDGSVFMYRDLWLSGGSLAITHPLGSSVFDRQAQLRIYGLNCFQDIGVFDDGKGYVQVHQYNVGNRPLLLNPAGANVGVNTDDPQAPLDVHGELRAKHVSLTSTDAEGGSYLTSVNRVHICTADGAPVFLNPNGGEVIVGGPVLPTRSAILTVQNMNGKADVEAKGNEANLRITAPSGSAWVFARRADVGGDNDDLKLLRYANGQYQGLALQIENATGNAIFSGNVRAKTLELTSDRAQKGDFGVVDCVEVLAKLAALPVSTWHYTKEKAVHMGPMSQDFSEAFGLGDSDKQISVVDGIGVALAGIKGLNEKLETALREKGTRIAGLEDDMRQKDARIAALEKQVSTLQQDLLARVAAIEKQVAQSAPTSGSDSSGEAVVAAVALDASTVR